MSYGVLACITNSECCRQYRSRKESPSLSSQFHMFLVLLSVHFSNALFLSMGHFPVSEGCGMALKRDRSKETKDSAHSQLKGTKN